nr:DUF4493 domain-containing protein [Alistipes onderdonkii]
MKKQLIYLLASACLLAAGCSTENKTDETGYGTLAINCTADTSIDTASAEASGTPEAPAAGAFSLTVTGETGTQKWDTLTEFEQSQTVFRMGAYTVAIAHGDPDAEGAGKPYYYAEQKIEVLPRRTVNADLTATVANSQVVIRATEQFLAYFHDARFTVTTASGNEFAFTPGSDPADEPVFVKGGTRLTVTGTARRQSPTGTGEGPEVTFSAQTLDATTPRTCHIITYDAKNAGSDNRTDVMAMTVSTRQTADTGEYDPLQHQTVYIYNDEGGLLRKYTSKEACPERLELLAGTYRVAVEAGEEAPADFTKRLYKGEETFTVKPGETTNVAVVCQIVNTVVEVKFDDSILQNLAPGYSVWIAGGEKVDEQAAEAGSVPAHRFTAEGTGYYTLPAGMTSLAWLFRGTHVEGKNVEMEDYIPNVKAGGKYTLTFKYSPDLPGYIDCVLISVDPGTDDKDDEIIFSPDPAVISEGFDIAEIQKYVSGEKKYRILAFSELTRFTVSVGDKSYDALNGTTEGISLEPVDKYNVRLTLSDAFFASCQAGDQKVTLRIEDANGGSSEVATTYRLEGLVPVTADDYDLWANTVTLRVVSFTPGTTVQFGLRSSGGEWQPMAGTSQGDDFITATYAPQWEEKTTADWSTPATVLPYSRLKKGTGISAGNTYDYKATVGSKELSGRFTADEGAPMTDGSLESWRSAQQFPGSGTNYTFWGSGYNPFAKELCTRDEAMPGRVGTYCAKLSATYNTLAKVPAPGNLFTGDFAIQVLGGMGGNVSFGKKFAYNARPRAVRFKYHATIGEVNYNLHGGKIPVGEMDKARIFVCIVDWTAQQKVFAGTKAPTGTWDPETQTEAANGPIIGYASKFIEETTQGDEMVEVILPINYYQDTAAAPDGKYNIVVSCSTSAYGDYMDACTTNVMYVDDFEWVY